MNKPIHPAVAEHVMEENARLREVLRCIADLPMDRCSTENDYRLSAAKAIALGALSQQAEPVEPAPAPGRFAVEEELRAAVTAQPAEAEGVDFGFDDRSVKVSQEAYSIFMERERHHLAALTAVTAERDRLREEMAELWKRIDKFQSQSHGITALAEIERLRAEVEGMRKDAVRWRYVSLQGDDTHWLNLLRVDLDEFGGNINAAVDALIDGEAPAMAEKEE